MAYTLNTVDLFTYGIMAGHIESSNIAIGGAFDMPARIGDVFHDWGDDNGLEIYSASGDLFWGGRDITFEGHISGARTTIYSALNSFYGDVSSVSGLSVFSTPYGDFNVYPKIANPTHFIDISKLRIEFREPVVDISGGSMPATGSDKYMIDNIPMSSFGLYTHEYKGVIGLPEMKEQLYTKIEAEGFRISKREAGVVDFTGWLIANDLITFKNNIKNLYALFQSEGERTFSINNQATITGVPIKGFKVDNVIIADEVIARFKTEITVSSIV